MQETTGRDTSSQHARPLSYRLKGAADATGLSVRTLERAIARRELDVVRVGRTVLILASSLERWLAGLAAAEA